LSWHAAAITLELFEDLGIHRIHDHDVALADRLRAGLELAPSNSAIVSFKADDRARAGLEDAGIKASVRAGNVRLSVHLYNTRQDIDQAVEALSGSPRALPPSAPRA
jgi:selenocysteine lyase/cysteine desulfurase